MNSAREIRRRIRSIAGTAQITRAMQMVAASKMRRAQQAVLDAAPFARALYRIQRHATTHVVDFRHALLERRAVRRRAVVLIGADKGLCGALNTNLFRLAAQYDPATTRFVAAGRKAAQFVSRSGRDLVAEFPCPDAPRFADARAISAFARDLFLTNQVDEVLLVAARFINTLVQQPVSLELLPVGAITGVTIPTMESEAELTGGLDCTFEPSAAAVLSYLLSHYVNISVYFTLLHAKASEQSARMVSMKSATDSANSLMHELTLAHNKLRQGSITTELLEIAGGQAG